MTLDFSRVTPAASVVTMAEAKAHLQVTDTAHDADITVKLAAAEEQVFARLGPAGDATWNATTAPQGVRSAILILLDAFYERRGGDESTDALRKALDTVDQLLGLYRDPVIA